MLTGAGTPFRADTADMVQARADFQSRHHFEPLARAVADAAAYATQSSTPMLLDAGAGTGYYLEAARQALPDSRAVALDISRYALRRCARSAHSVGALQPISLVWDVWRRLPLQDGTADVVLSIFAPRNIAEFQRVLHPGGSFLVVTPLPGHLAQLQELMPMLGLGAGKAAALRGASASAFNEVSSREISYTMRFSADDIRDAVLMGPSAFHTTREELAATAALAPSDLPVTARFCLQVFSRR